jgi:hypothetical protein
MGRPPGVPNKLTRIIKEAILLAGEAQGNKLARANKEVPEGPCELFVKWLADKHPQSYAALLGKVLPGTSAGRRARAGCAKPSCTAFPL